MVIPVVELICDGSGINSQSITENVDGLNDPKNTEKFKGGRWPFQRRIPQDIGVSKNKSV